MITKTNHLEKFQKQNNNALPLDFSFLVFEKLNIEPPRSGWGLIAEEIAEALSLYEYELNDLNNEELLDEIEPYPYYYQLKYWMYRFPFAADYFNDVLNEILHGKNCTKDTNYYKICAEAQQRWRIQVYNAVRLVLLEDPANQEN